MIYEDTMINKIHKKTTITPTSSIASYCYVYLDFQTAFVFVIWFLRFIPSQCWALSHTEQWNAHIQFHCFVQ